MSKARDMSVPVPNSLYDVALATASLSPSEVQPAEGLQTDWLARSLRAGADVCSFLRGAGGVVLGYNIAKNEPPPQDWKRAGVFALLAATDWLDGRLARAAQSRDGIKSRYGGWKDQLNDKVFITLVTVGLGIAYARADPLLSKTAVLSAGITAVRDTAVTVKRVQAEKQGLDTDAKKSGKSKMLAQIIALGLATTPLIRYAPVRRAVAAGIAGSTGLSVSSGVEYFHTYNKQLR
jgi:phosphatidylglycerophosphate synthase